MSENGGPQSPQRRKAYSVAKQIGLTRDDRIELAEYLLRRDVASWDGLSETQIERILDALEGFALVTHLLTMRAEATSSSPTR